MADGTTAEYHMSEEDRVKREEETRKAAVERLEERGKRTYARTADTGDATVGWTAQQGASPAVLTDTRRKYATWQLPDPEVARAAGVPPQDIPEDLVLDAGDEELVAHPYGVEPSELQVRDARAKVRERLLENERPAGEGDGQGVAQPVEDIDATGDTVHGNEENRTTRTTTTKKSKS